jgi:subtilase family serine protease
VGIVRLLKKVAVGIGSLAAAAGGLTSLGGPTAVVAAGQQAQVMTRPDLIQLGHRQQQVPTTASCEATYHVACYQPAQLQQAYNLSPLYHRGINGRGTTIAIVESFGSPTIRGDLATFDQTFGLPAPPTFTVIQPAGRVPPMNSGNDQMVGWAEETSLDVEYAHTIAPDANILLVETPVSETEGVTGFPQIVTAEDYLLSHYRVDVISQSFAATEQTFPSFAALRALRAPYLDAYRQHVTVLASSGNNGVTSNEQNGTLFYTFPVVSWPASDPLVTAVGGTELHLGANGNRTSPDTAWNETFNVTANKFVSGTSLLNPLASGGGKSIFFTRPSYQNGVRNIVGHRRGIPDISMSAGCDGAVDIYDTAPGGGNGWTQTCGTSESAPLFAGIVALAAQVAGRPLGLINPALYQMSLRKMPGIVPVTSGNNTVWMTQGGRFYTVPGYSARAGYSLVTGVGTVNGALFVPELAHEAE